MAIYKHFPENCVHILFIAEEPLLLASKACTELKLSVRMDQIKG